MIIVGVPHENRFVCYRFTSHCFTPPPLPVPPSTSFDGLHMEMNYFDLNRSKVESVRFIRAVRRHYPHGWLSRLFALTGKWSLLVVSRKRTINDNDSEPSGRSSIHKVHLQTVPAIAYPKVYHPDRGQKDFTAVPSKWCVERARTLAMDKLKVIKVDGQTRDC